jgi:hypothetical protein
MLHLLVACSQQLTIGPIGLLWQTSTAKNNILVVFVPGVLNDKEGFNRL